MRLYFKIRDFRLGRVFLIILLMLTVAATEAIAQKRVKLQQADVLKGGKGFERLIGKVPVEG